MTNSPSSDADRVSTHLAESLHPLERKVIPLFQAGGPRSESELLAADPALQPAQLSMALGWLQTKGIVAVFDEIREEWVSLTPRGAEYAKTKNPALQMLDEMNQPSIRLQDLGRTLDPEERSATIGALKKLGLFSIQPGGLLIRNYQVVPEEFIRLQRVIESLASASGAEGKPCPIASFPEEAKGVIRAYHHKRSPSKGIFRVDERIIRRFTPAPFFQAIYEGMLRTETPEGGKDEIGVLTPEMLKEGSWRGRSFRKYNLELPPSRIGSGRRHPYSVFLNQVREKLMAMGFTEMEGPLIESEFWNMDALYMPQFHPARAIHDVYFIKGGLRDETLPEALITRVAKAHENGGAMDQTGNRKTASRGWGYQFDRERTRRLILRSQGTAVSARRLAQGVPASGKYFAIARCFRYDAVDATHAPDFFQVEGIVVGEEIHFRTLLGLLALFAREVALAGEVRFLPAYFPFTEPSVEMHAAHPQLGWMELGGAGLFRPEVTQPLGVQQPVIAWGLGLDRLAMTALQISDIRDLFATDLEKIRETSIPRAPQRGAPQARGGNASLRSAEGVD